MLCHWILLINIFNIFYSFSSSLSARPTYIWASNVLNTWWSCDENHHTLDSSLPHCGQHRPSSPGSQSASVCTVWPVLTVQPPYSFSVRAAGLSVAKPPTLLAIDWSLTVTDWQWPFTGQWLTDSDHLLYNYNDCQWPLTYYWQWLIVTIYSTFTLLTVTIAWALTDRQ